MNTKTAAAGPGTHRIRRNARLLRSGLDDHRWTPRL